MTGDDRDVAARTVKRLCKKSDEGIVRRAIDWSRRKPNRQRTAAQSRDRGSSSAGRDPDRECQP
jgi:hypothetical protein